MERPLVCKHLTASLTGPEHLAAWSQVLLRHHQDIQTEIEQVATLLAQPLCHLHRIEARLRRLSRAVLMHLELEACFLDPAVREVSGSGGAKLQALRDGYESLRRAVMATADFLQREKLSHPSLTLSTEQQHAITRLMDEIRARLRAEDRDYQQFREGRTCT
ncbi:hypothetical protein [Sedimenticola hydrogenitrophicus]|uniref:hypothetical protein n=1 Tax=Sedimenticola hydrogenitrophicus TaxID=2967975 RepID=UPI0021A491DC|nr:hypothetical protein [Sedimenticola hydrogenitrophicus]